MNKLPVAVAIISALLSVSFLSPTMARAPLGFQLMCLNNPGACKAGGAPSVTVNSDLITALNRVNRQINRSITPRNDQGPDVWSLSAKTGDCEDFVMAKRMALLSMGLPSSALRIAYVKTRQGEGHALLVIKSDKGDIALDNLTNEIKLLGATGYQVMSLSGANPLKWF